MTDLSKITCIEDLRLLAQRRVPRMFYDYADSGSWTESTYRANQADFQNILFKQRVAINMEGRSTATTMIGEPVTMPVALAPTAITAGRFRCPSRAAKPARMSRVSPSTRPPSTTAQ